jgi:hypothetical protein
MTASPRVIAAAYLDRGWAPIPVPLGAKNPGRSGWQHLRITQDTLAHHFSDHPGNIGILLGTPSGGLVDIDLDCPEAIVLAPHLLPPTPARFGRPSAPGSHWLYQVAEPVKSNQFRDPTRAREDERAMLVELRSTGRQTLFPGSVHPSGEPVEWASDGDPAAVPADELVAAVRRLAAATLLGRSWPAHGTRHQAALALAGGLLRAEWSIDDGEAFVRAVVAAAGDPEVDDRVRAVRSTADALAAGNQVTGWPRLAEFVGEGVGKAVCKWLGITARRNVDGNSATSSGGADRESSQASKLVDLVKAAGIDLFHDETGDPYLSLDVDGHLETWPVRARTVRSTLARLYYLDTGKAPNAQAVADALQVLEGEARFAGPERPVAVRLADHDGMLYLDLGDPAWQVVAIRTGRWEMVGPEDVPVRFRRPRGMEPLPEPHRGGSLAALAPLVNVQDESDFLLIAGWLIGCLYPRGPRPALQLLGEQGSAKSTLARLLRSLVDPSTVPLRSQPQKEDDLLIAARNGLVVALDNLSEIKPWLSDALCRLATGGGLSKRELYTDAEEVLLDAQRPVLLTAICEVATASDLLDRCITVTLPPIPSERRKTEAEIALLVRIARPAVLGALLNAAAAALVRLPSIVLDRKPRMADFATWVEAAAPSFGWEPEAFLDALEANRRNADAVAIEALPVGPVLLTFLAGLGDEWSGTASELLAALNGVASDEVRKERGWPKRANQLSNQIRRLAPNLRRVGVSVSTGRRGGDGQRLLVLDMQDQDFHRHNRHGSSQTAETGTEKNAAGDNPHRHSSSQDRYGSLQRTMPSGTETPDVTICDDCDDDSAPFSRELFAANDATPPAEPGANDEEECEWTA